MRLQHENTMLKMNQKEPEEDKISVLQSILDNTRQQYNELRLDNRYFLIYFFKKIVFLVHKIHTSHFI